MLRIVALMGLILLKKPFSAVVTGKVKTMAGVLILFIAVDVLNRVIHPISQLFSQIYTYAAISNGADWTAFFDVGPGAVLANATGGRWGGFWPP